MPSVNEHHVASAPDTDGEHSRSESTEYGRTSSDSEDDVLAKRRQQKKKYKPTYYARKDEITTLQTQIETLTNTVDEMKANSKASAYIRDPVVQNVLLRQGLKASDLALGGAQSVMSSHLAEHMRNPLHTYTHLTTDISERQATLAALRKPKLDDALVFLLQRVHSLDLRRSHRQCESFNTENGDYIFTQCDVTPFRGVTSVKDVYNDVLAAFLHQEYSVWEKLNITTLCDADDVEDGLFSACRFLSTTAEGVEVEKNVVSFRRFEETSSLINGAHGLIVLSPVDVDEMYPYQPLSRVRMDLTQVVLVCQNMKHEGDQTVSMVRWSYKRAYRPLCGLSPETNESIAEQFAQWCDVIRKVVREFVEARRKGMALVL
ncbi:hypothetical protein Poli38472_012366 [Pythium oligandrum]|uniref:Uncharacterized protein n=1 Tax=Pythium oligandrum TaxID=41045 RepID=A0A8K1CR77_PYTOL|nr:hypothetical protein Poli38472_012366 [Pythium oligandrum]|eukprot:TMW67250.1 hypothetical protein Poli38472_012366 [Pythium oligandrum]